MIIIDTLKIDSIAENITIDVKTDVGSLITKISVWNTETYKNPTEVIDLSSLLLNTSEIENLVITAQELSVEKITGIWFIEFESNVIQEDGSTDTALGVVANLIQYYEYVLSGLIEMGSDIVSCTSAECGKSKENLFYVDALLNTLKDAIRFGYYEESIKMINNLDDLCNITLN